METVPSTSRAPSLHCSSAGKGLNCQTAILQSRTQPQSSQGWQILHPAALELHPATQHLQGEEWEWVPTAVSVIVQKMRGSSANQDSEIKCIQQQQRAQARTPPSTSKSSRVHEIIQYLNFAILTF